jgi:hypothetical protein
MLTDNDKKLELVQWIIELNDSKMILDLMQMKKADQADFADTLSLRERSMIESGLKDLEEGRVVPHSEVMKRFDKWK